MTWLDTPEGRACIEAAAVAMALELGHAMLAVLPPKAGPNTVAMTRRVLAAALDVRVDCAECEGSGLCGEWHYYPKDGGRRRSGPRTASCESCDGSGTVPVLYPREEKP